MGDDMLALKSILLTQSYIIMTLNLSINLFLEASIPIRNDRQNIMFIHMNICEAQTISMIFMKLQTYFLHIMILLSIFVA